MPKLHLKQPGFTYSTCRQFSKHCGRIQKFRETSNLTHLYKNELDKANFAHDAAYSDSKDLGKRTTWDQILEDKAYQIAGNHKYDGYQRALASIVYQFFKQKKQDEEWM